MVWVFLFLATFLQCCSEVVPPRSLVKYRPVYLVEWVWCGALTPVSAVVKAKLSPDVGKPALRVSRWPDFRESSLFVPTGFDRSTGVVNFELSGLKSDQVYFYAVESEGRLDLVRPGRFRTPGQSPFSFKFVFGACARTGSNASVFDTIRDYNPLFFLHLGDFHYQDLRATRVTPYREVMDHVLASPTQSLLFRTVPIVYVWDDHDFGGDSSDSSHPGRRAVRQLYQQYVPHYPLAAGGGDTSIQQAFTIGRVRFLLTDVRSERKRSSELSGSTILGEQQKSWLKEELSRASSQIALLVWCNTVPWIASESPAADHWGGFAEERRELAEVVARRRPGGLLMLSADAHMLAIDDGSHSDYSGFDARAFPVFQAAALDREGSIKGGPYSHGVSPGSGRFGLVEIEDTGKALTVKLSGRNWADRELMSYSFTVQTEVASE